MSAGEIKTTSANSHNNIFNSSPKKQLSVQNVEDMEDDTICGVGTYRPQWLQKWATSRTLIVLFSVIGILQGSQFPYLIGVLSTLEKRYAFSNKVSSAISSMDEICPIILGFIIGHFGGRSNRPKIVSLGMILSGFTSILSAFPYFIYGTADNLIVPDIQDHKGSHYCSVNKTEEICEMDERSPKTIALTCIMLANFLKGFGNIAFYTAGTSYLDDCTKRKNTPLYFAFALTLRCFGPIMGFLMSSLFLRYYENPLVDPGFGPEDPRWVGAWWIGFLLQGSLLCIFTLPLLLFPRRLPRRPKLLPVSEQKEFKEVLKELFKSLRRLFKNPLFMSLALATIPSPSFMYFVVLPKYVENRFHLTTADASIFSGPAGVISLQISTLVGGYVIWKWQPTARQVAAASIFISLILIVAYMALMVPSCKSRFDESLITTEGLNLINKCNIDCACSTDVMSPICGNDGKTSYYSPCFAGCIVSVTEDEVQERGGSSS